MSLVAAKRVGRRKGYRADPLWIAALVHRMSGLLLALFLPLHFLTLGLALEGEDKFDRLMRWSDLTVVKLAEAVLVLLLAVHLLGGIRVLVIENSSWRGARRWPVLVIAAISAALAGLFLAQVL